MEELHPDDARNVGKRNFNNSMTSNNLNIVQAQIDKNRDR